MTEVTFSDILIKPQYSEVESRSDVDLHQKFGPYTLGLPVISANMKHITGYKMAVEMAMRGGLGILHRFNTTEEAVEEYSKTLVSGVSVGVKEEDKDRFSALFDAGARLFCIDVAHGHHANVRRMLTWIRNKYQKEPCVIAGNIATAEAAGSLSVWGADILKVGIGPGSVCETRKNTGVGVPQFWALKEISEALERRNSEVQLIADGGIKCEGDIAKALIYADAVMIGSLFAGATETPGKVFQDHKNLPYKVYGGSASGEVNDTTRFVEGVMTTVPFKGHVQYILEKMEDGLRSALSLSGAHNLDEFRSKVKWNVISNGGRLESKF